MPRWPNAEACRLRRQSSEFESPARHHAWLVQRENSALVMRGRVFDSPTMLKWTTLSPRERDGNLAYLAASKVAVWGFDSPRSYENK